MPRVFLSLVAANLLCLVGAAGLGLSVSWTGPDRHVILAVFSLVLTCLLQVLVFTYFTISGKVIGQAVHVAKLDLAAVDECRVLKRAVTFTLAASFASIVLVTATGASAWRTGQFSISHMLAAGLALAVHVYVWVKEYDLVVRQAALLAATLSDYNKKRESRSPVR